MSDYIDIQTASWDEIPEKKTLPVGTYLLKGRSAKYNPPKEDGKNGNVMFVYEPRQAMDDVDDDAFQELGSDYDLANNPIFFRIWIERQTDWQNVKRHLEKHGIDVSGGIQKSFEQFKGNEVLAYLSTRTFTNGAGETVEDNDASNFAPVD